MMRIHLAAGLASALLLCPVSASSQVFEVGPGGVRFGGPGGGGRCEQLRRACEMKDQLGERGEGNCRRYRITCLQRPVREVSCSELRRACLFKDEIGERGSGNCRRYRSLCRGID